MNALLSYIDKEMSARGKDGWRIIHGDCLRILPQLPDNSADLVFADPPYNLQLKKELYRPNMTRVAGVDDSWDKFSSFLEYDNFCKQWLLECRRILKDNGAIWTIGTYHNIGRVKTIMQDLGFWLQNDVIWHKTNPMPNFRGVRFTNATETLVWAKKSEKGRAVFNHKTMKAENGGKQMTNVWQFPLCGGKERLRDLAGNKLHSTQKPEALLRRLILATTRRGDVVLDPFLGSGTTAAAAKKLGRIGIGLERELKYIKIAAKRIAAAELEELPAEESAAAPRRVAFSELIKRGLIKPGAVLQSKNGAAKARVLADGNIKVNGAVNAAGSIHRIGAKVANTPTCNGWNFWRIKVNGGESLPINTLREKAREFAGAGK